MPSGVYVRTEEHRRQIADSNRRRVVTAETRRKMSETRKGRPSPLKGRKGKPMSDEAKRNLSEYWTPEMRRAKSEAQIGVSLSAEHRRAISESWTPERREAQAEVMRERTVSDETRRKASHATSRYITFDHPLWKPRMRMRVRRRIFFLDIFRARTPDGIVRCVLCGEEVNRFEGRAGDSLSMHSLDGDPKNWTLSNRVPTHSSCRSSFQQWQKGWKLRKTIQPETATT